MASELPPRLRNADVPDHVRDVLTRLREGGFEAFMVGGCVRDLLLGRTPQDFDVATRALPQEVQRLFRKVIPTGIEHGTVTVLSGGHPVEVTTYRYESDYVDGRRPSRIEFHHNIEEDLARRDFTINAMAFNPIEGVLKDPFGGEADLGLRRVRCVGVAAERFNEDGLRPLRAVRIATVLGFALEPDTEAAIAPAVPVFRKVALERVHDELLKLLRARDVSRGLGLLSSTELLAVFLPEVASDSAASELFAAVGRAPPEEIPRLAVLLSKVEGAGRVLARLKFPNRISERVGRICAHPLAAQAQGTDAALRRWMAQLLPENVEDAVAAWRALGSVGSVGDASLGERALALKAARPPLFARDLALDGGAIMRLLNVRPSRVVGDATRFLLEIVLDQPTENTEAALTARLLAWAASRG